MRFVVDLSTVTLGDVAELTRIPIALVGRWVKGKQKFAITSQTIKELFANFRKRMADLVVDYEHASEFPERAQGGPVPAAGWVKKIDEAPDEQGILWGFAEFTQRAREMIEAGEYKYISPAIALSARDKVSGEPQGATLTSIALVNRPFLDAMPAIQLSETGWRILSEKERTTMPVKAKKVTLAESGNGAVAICGEGDQEVQVEFDDLRAVGLMPAAKTIHLSDVKRTTDGRFNFAAIETGDGTLIGGDVLHAMAVESELQKAVDDGKITPAQRPHFEKLALSDLDGFRELVKDMKAQVDLSEHGTAAGKAAGGGSEFDQVNTRLDTEAKKRMRENKDLTYSVALSELADTPDGKRRLQLIEEMRQ